MEVMLRHQHDVTDQSLDVVLTELQLLRVMRMMMAVPKVSRRREMSVSYGYMLCSQINP